MGSGDSPPAAAFVRALAAEARRRQVAARDALGEGRYTRATALLADAELLAEDVHDCTRELERRWPGAAADLAAFDTRPAPAPEPQRRRPRLGLPSRRWRIAIGAGLALGLALGE
ncbi:hypothetical protein ACLBKU_16295 [Erythrobacter sp. NE805]|uniref:hypothetical protein n=1 Tax=Erythrobacter sp. NE805 TaxID=3389875 RepID=UPI00396B08E4